MTSAGNRRPGRVDPGAARATAPAEWPADPSRKMLALAGVIAAAAGIALSQAAGGALRVESGPVEAVAAAVRDFTPGPIAVFLVHLVGAADKPLLLGGTAVAVLGICGYAASLMRRHPLLPDLVFFALTVIGLAAILRLPSPGIGSALALMVGLVTWIVTLRVLTAPLLGEVAGESTPDLRRRDFLIRSGWVVGAVAVLTIGGRFAGSGRRHAEQARRLLRLPVRHGEVPVGADIGVPGIQPWRTPTSDFYLIHTALAPPSISPPDWRLRIHGMVETRADVQLPGPDRPPADRGLDHPVLRLERGGWGSHRQRLVVRRTRARAARRGRREARSRRGAADLPGRLELRYAAVRAHRRPQRDAGRRP